MNRPSRHKREPRRKRVRPISKVYLVGDEYEEICAVFDSESKAFLFITSMEQEYEETYTFLGEWEIL